MFSYEICGSVIDTRNVSPVGHAKTTTTPVDLFDVQNNIEQPVVVGYEVTVYPW
jgi:hypothetical protein